MRIKYWFAVPILLSVTWTAQGAEQPPAPAPIAPAPAAEAVPDAAAVPAETLAPAAPAPPAAQGSAAIVPAVGTAVVKGDNVNVRGQPTVHSEVVFQLRQGDRVVVLDEVVRTDAKPEEPAKWTKIALPPSVPIWVHSGFIDPETKAIKPQRLNLRSGPGENYSVLGRVERGTVVRELETQGAWWRIEAPATAYAFVASQLLDKEAAPTEVAVAPPPPEPVAEPAAVEPAAVEPAMIEPAAADTTGTTEPAPAGPVVTPATDIVATATEPVAPATNAVAPEIEYVEGKEPARRVVSREGIVRRSISVQAPTYFSLESRHSRKTINYLYSPPSNNIILRDFEGQRILVTGEELIDERWPKTPVINVEKLRTMP